MAAPAHKDPIFTDEDAARAHFEALRWPNGPQCPFCGTLTRVAALGGKSMGPGWYHCKDCRKKFTALVGTVYERSHIPLTMWLYVTHLMCSSKKGISSHQIMRMTGLTYKSAWFMTHRIREAMDAGALPPIGGEGKVVEADETYIGRKAGKEAKRGHGHKRVVMALVERGGEVRTFHVGSGDGITATKIVAANVAKESRLMTDETRIYDRAGATMAGHESVNHTDKEYVRGDVHTNTIEGYFGLFKRGFNGIYQHCAEKYLDRYLTEYEFRYNHRIRLGFDDDQRAVKAVQGAVGKRLTYRQTVSPVTATYF
jgi:transposase-like protein